MTKRQKIAFQKQFFVQAGSTLRAVKEIMDGLPDVGFYIKDLEGRIITFNKRNCEICNLNDEFSAVGKRSDEIFPESKSTTYLSGDRKVLRTKRPLHTTHTHPADSSMRISHKSIYPLRSADETRIIGTMCVYKQSKVPESSLDWHDCIKDITSYINAHHTEDLSLKKLSEIGMTTPSKLVRAFQRIINMTPAKYVTNVRINVARRLLEETNDSFSDIALAAGFYDFSHFFHTFKRERGITPSEYRKKHQSI